MTTTTYQELKFIVLYRFLTSHLLFVHTKKNHITIGLRLSIS